MEPDKELSKYDVKIIFSQDEEANELAYRKAVQAILFNTENNEKTNKDR